MDILETFARRLRDKRESLKLTQAQLGEKIGVTSQAISAYEKNIQGNGKSPTLDKLIQLANALGVTVDWLCGIDNQDNAELMNYGEAIELIDKLVFAFPQATTNYELLDDFSESANINIIDNTLAEYASRRDKMAALLKDGTIDDTLYKAWFDGEKAKLSKCIIGGVG